MSIKKDIEHFEYHKRYRLPNEHRWCYLSDKEKETEFWKKKAEKLEYKRSRVQSDPETTGQHGTMI